MHVEAGALGQPAADLPLGGRPSVYGVLVGAGVVHDQVHVQPLGNGLLDLSEEPQELLVPVAGFALGNHLSCGHVQGSKQQRKAPSPCRAGSGTGQ